MGPRGRASAPAFSSFSRARSSKTCRKPRVFTRFSRFFDRAADPLFFTFASARFSSHFLKRCENHAFSRVFRDSAANLVRAYKLPNLIFGVSRTNVRVQMTFGSFRGVSTPQKLIENNAFSRVFCVSVPSKAQRVLFCCFRKCCENRVFSHIFQTAGGYGSVPAFLFFSFARFSKTASETNFGHFSGHAWPQNIDFIASETIRGHFPSLIEPCMVRKYSFRGF